MPDLTRLSPPPMGQGFEGKDADAWKEFLYDLYRLVKFFHYGKGSPENVVTAPIGHLYFDLEGGAGTTVYSKEANSDSTGWSTIA